MVRRLLTACAVAGLALAACGGDDAAESDDEAEETPEESDAAGRDEYVAGLAEEMEGDPEFPLDEAQARCFAEAVVDTIGVEALADAGVTPEDLASGGEDAPTARLLDEDRDELTDALAECELSTALVAQIRDELGASDESTECIAQNIDEQEFAALLIGAAIGDEDEQSGEEFGFDIMRNLDGPCAKRVTVDVLSSEGVIPEEARACVAANISEGLAQRLLDPDVQQNDPEGLQADLQAAMAPCA